MGRHSAKGGPSQLSTQGYLADIRGLARGSAAARKEIRMLRVCAKGALLSIPLQLRICRLLHV